MHSLRTKTKRFELHEVPEHQLERKSENETLRYEDENENEGK